jgi:CRISPR-associated protein Csh1
VEQLGFLQAMLQMGQTAAQEGLEAYLNRPMDKDGKEIRVWLEVEGDLKEPLDITGVSRIDLADYSGSRAVLTEYMYRNPAGSNTTWAFSPIHRAGKMKNRPDKSLEALCPPDWREDKKSQFHKIRKRILMSYETEGYFAPGSVDRVMSGMEEKIHMVLPDLDNKQSYIIVFGIDRQEEFLYPGKVPAFEKYFQDKLEQNLSGGKKAIKTERQIPSQEKSCSLCNTTTGSAFGLDKVFKFNTFDKVNILAGLDKKESTHSFPVCQTCFEGISAGRGKVDRVLINSGVLPGVNIWAIPEAVGNSDMGLFKRFLHTWEASLEDKTVGGAGERTEGLYFSRLARTGQGLIFHFVFWEQNNAQEIVHLMVEDVPPERLARLESVWQRVCKEQFGWRKDTDLDFAVRSIYATLANYAGKSKGDKKVFRDFTLEIIGAMLQGEALPVDMFKRFIVPRLARLVYENRPDDYRRSMHYAELWVEYMQTLNREVI